MNSKLLQLSLIEILISIVLGITVLIFSFWFMTLYGRKKYKIETFNLSYAILKASVLFSVGYLMESVIQPLISTFRLLTGIESLAYWEMILKSIGYLSLFFVIAAFYAFLTIAVSVRAFTYLIRKFLHINEANEFRKDNIGVGIITAVIVIVMTLLLKSGLVILIESLIPFPDIMKI